MLNTQQVLVHMLASQKPESHVQFLNSQTTAETVNQQKEGDERSDRQLCFYFSLYLLITCLIHYLKTRVLLNLVLL